MYYYFSNKTKVRCLQGVEWFAPGKHQAITGAELSKKPLKNSAAKPWPGGFGRGAPKKE
jgi:hypothetical protein